MVVEYCGRKGSKGQRHPSTIFRTYPSTICRSYGAGGVNKGTKWKDLFFPSNRNAQTCPPSALPQARRAGKCKIHVVMSGDVFHIPALGEQITNIAKISIIGNLRNSLLLYPHCFRNFLLRPSKAAQTKDNGVSTRFLSGYYPRSRY